MDKPVWNGIEIMENGSISKQDAKAARQRLRVLIEADIQKLALVVEDLEKLQNRWADLATIEFTIEDLSHPKAGN